MSDPQVDAETGLPYPKLQVYVASEVPFLVRQAAQQAGFPHSTLWVRDRLARLLAEELGESYDELMESMPPSWSQRPGFIKKKTGVQSGTGG